MLTIPLPASDNSTSGGIKVETEDVDVAVYWHHPSDGSRKYLVIDVDTYSESDADDGPGIRVYRNDGLVHEENST